MRAGKLFPALAAAHRRTAIPCWGSTINLALVVAGDTDEPIPRSDHRRDVHHYHLIQVGDLALRKGELNLSLDGNSPLMTLPTSFLGSTIDLSLAFRV